MMEFLWEQWVEEAESKYGLVLEGSRNEDAREFFLQGKSLDDLMAFYEEICLYLDHIEMKKGYGKYSGTVAVNEEIPF